MITLITINFLIVILLGLLLYKPINYFAKSMFFDISVIYLLVIIVSPIVLTVINLLYLALATNKNFLIGLYPLLLPIIYFLKNNFEEYYYKKTAKHIEGLTNDILSFVNEKEVNLDKEDIRIRIMPQKRIEIIIQTSTNKSYLKRILMNNKHNIQRQSATENYHLSFYIVEKKSKPYSSIALV